ncbi:hypothetical protein AB0C40_32040 [Streptomyces brevispora]|uniref:hypothetical protein n=1 Tax=Streptomyces brevispora TaxID=887462 RepID=UPI003400095C
MEGTAHPGTTLPERYGLPNGWNTFSNAESRYKRQVLVGDFSPEPCDDYLAARMERMDWRMRVLGDQLGDVKKAMDLLRRKLPDR